MTSATSAALGWGVVFLIAGFYFVNSHQKNKCRRSLLPKESSKPNDTRREIKPKKSRKNLQPNRCKPEEKLSQEERQTSADELMTSKTGTSPIVNSPVPHKPKSMKQALSHKKQDFIEGKPRAESLDNATGNEADDESSQDSPEYCVRMSGVLPASQDVSDMLEKPSTITSVLRVTASTSDRQNQSERKKAPKKVELIETKKQRQNRKKAAEAKIFREQEEKARKIKLEEQRRMAREAEGRAAKDGSLFLASQIPQTSSWITQPAILNHNIVSKPRPDYSEAEDLGSASQDASVLSEEEQVRHAIKETETWNVVKGKEKRNRINKGSDTESSKPEIRAQEPLRNKSTPTTQATAPIQMSRYSLQAERSYNEESNNLEDSEWEVS